jgi:hypothetical protein
MSSKYCRSLIGTGVVIEAFLFVGVGNIDPLLVSLS